MIFFFEKLIKLESILLINIFLCNFTGVLTRHIDKEIFFCQIWFMRGSLKKSIKISRDIISY